jgi:hypothetical protein
VPGHERSMNPPPAAGDVRATTGSPFPRDLHYRSPFARPRRRPIGGSGRRDDADDERGASMETGLTIGSVFETRLATRSTLVTSRVGRDTIVVRQRVLFAHHRAIRCHSVGGGVS